MGKTPDAIVKTCCCFLREGSSNIACVGTSRGVLDEASTLAIMACAPRTSFQKTMLPLPRDFDASAGEIDCFPQEITRLVS